MSDRVRQGVILKGIGGFYYVKTADGVLECKAKGIFRKRGITPLAGDQVMVEGGGEDLVIADILPRKNAFARPPIANVDRIFLVVSAIDPKPNILVVDRLTAIACYNGVMPVIVLTKTDVTAAADFHEIYKQAGFQVIDLRKRPQQGFGTLRELCRGALSVFIGNSGVGKSTLLNELSPGLALETAHTSKKLGRGKHTTRAVTLYDFLDGFVADTPGFSAMEFERGGAIEKQQLAACFPDIAPYTNGCYFSGCSHTVEKGCAVLEALQRGEIQKSRHESYCVLFREAEQIKAWEIKE